MELTVAEGDSVNGIKRWKMAVSLIYLHLLCTNIHHRAILFWCTIMKMHLRTDSSIKREGKKLLLCVCVLKGNEAEAATCVQHFTYCFHHLFPLTLCFFYW